jgi:uncharacterized DUF497 family protein
MEFEGFDWDEGNRAKCQKHGLSLAEIESVFASRVLILDDPGNSEAEPRSRAIGVTAKGRRAFVAFTRRGNLIRPISARYMHKKEIVRYEKDNSDL